MATIYVSLGGNDTTGDGTSGNPYRTWAKCLAMATAGGSAVYGSGDTIQALDAGPYAEGRVGNVAKQSLTLRGVAGGTVIDASASVNDGLVWYHMWDLYDLTVHSAPLDGFKAQSSGRTARLTRCTSYGHGRDGIDSLGAPDCELYHCISRSNAEKGINLGAGSASLSHCLVHDCGHDGIYATSASALVEFSTSALNSVASGSGAYGIYAGTVRSSIAYANELSYGIRATTYDHCLSYGHTTANYYSSPDVDSLELDPLFVDAAGDDYHLTALSPATLAGEAGTLGITTDLDGVALSSPPSMGAYEWVPPVVPPDPRDRWDPLAVGLAQVTSGWTGSVAVTDPATGVVATVSPPGRTSAAQVWADLLALCRRLHGSVSGWECYAEVDGKLTIVAEDLVDEGFDLDFAGNTGTRLGFADASYSGQLQYTGETAHEGATAYGVPLIIDGAPGLGNAVSVPVASGTYAPSPVMTSQSVTLRIYDSTLVAVLGRRSLVGHTYDAYCAGTIMGRVQLRAMRATVRVTGERPGTLAVAELEGSTVTL